MGTRREACPGLARAGRARGVAASLDGPRLGGGGFLEPAAGDLAAAQLQVGLFLLVEGGGLGGIDRLVAHLDRAPGGRGHVSHVPRFVAFGHVPEHLADARCRLHGGIRRPAQRQDPQLPVSNYQVGEPVAAVLALVLHHVENLDILGRHAGRGVDRAGPEQGGALARQGRACFLGQREIRGRGCAARPGGVVWVAHGVTSYREVNRCTTTDRP